MASFTPAIPDAAPGANDNAAPACPAGQVSTYNGSASTPGSLSEALNRTWNAAAARYTGGVAPSAIWIAYLDWLLHLGLAPGSQMKLVQDALKSWMRYLQYLSCAVRPQDDGEQCVRPLPQDHRFTHPHWQTWPFNAIHQGFLLTQQWWHQAATSVPGVNARHQGIVEFVSRQLLDMLSPSNFFWTNPEILDVTVSEQGWNFERGMKNLSEDLTRLSSGMASPKDEDYQVGETVAVTPGKVIFRNHLIELLQYDPVTAKVDAEPVLITPAWIMKYYILDLSPENSLIRYMVGQGHTVFMISWRNPTRKDRDLGFEDYLNDGVMAALDAVRRVQPDRRVHLTGYCLGGTLAAVAAASLGREKDRRLKSLSLFAAQVDFEEAGELTLFINESQIAFLEDMMWEQGVLDERQMSGAFQMLRSNDLIWSRLLSDYWLGKPRHRNDLMAWNADGTRMPYKMHSEYLRKLFLNNDLAEGRLQVEGHSIAVSDIRVPIFAVGTTRDHVAPWKSVYKIHLLSDSDVTFVLTSGGHNAGIVSEPGHQGRSYKLATTSHASPYKAPEIWETETDEVEGSWWPAWHEWLNGHSSGKEVPPESKPLFLSDEFASVSERSGELQEAPGTYVMQQ